jgi:hypothetical protein
MRGYAWQDNLPLITLSFSYLLQHAHTHTRAGTSEQGPGTYTAVLNWLFRWENLSSHFLSCILLATVIGMRSKWMNEWALAWPQFSLLAVLSEVGLDVLGCPRAAFASHSSWIHMTLVSMSGEKIPPSIPWIFFTLNNHFLLSLLLRYFLSGTSLSIVCIHVLCHG